MNTHAPDGPGYLTGTDTPSDEGRVDLLSASFARLRAGILAMPFIGLLFGLLFAWQGGNPTGLLVWSGIYLTAAWAARHMYRRYQQDRV